MSTVAIAQEVIVLTIGEQIAVCDGKQCGQGQHVSGGRYVCPHNNLAAMRPDLMKEWDYEKNKEVDPTKLTLGSHKKAWWKCSNGTCECHEWVTAIKERTRKNKAGKKSTGCPYCNMKKICSHNNLEVKFPEVAAQWHPTFNGNLKPIDVASGSHQKVWWKCINSLCECHVWEAIINDRTSSNHGCPYCNIGRVCPHNNLQVKFPEISAEWHPTHNGDLTPFNVSSWSSKNAWWKCSKALCECHVWDTTIGSRTSNNRGCPYCDGKKVCPHNNLEVKFPEVAAEWHPTFNGNLKPIDVASGSRQKVWWKCYEGSCECHVWNTTINSRTSNNQGCPYCNSGKVCPHNNLEVKFPEVAAEWHPTLNDDLKPSDVAPYSSQKRWWKCSTNSTHVWNVVIASRTCGSGCPRCNQSKGEKACQNALNKLQISFQSEFILSSLPRKRFDFQFIYNGNSYLIEFDGQQHFEYIPYFHQNGEAHFLEKQQVDIAKTLHALQNNYRLIRIDYTQVDNVADHIQSALDNLTDIYTSYWTNPYLYEYIIVPLEFHRSLKII